MSVEIKREEKMSKSQKTHAHSSPRTRSATPSYISPPDALKPLDEKTSNKFQKLFSFAEFYNNEKLSDVQLKIPLPDGTCQRFHAHKFVLSARSDTFAKMLTVEGKWKESKSTEFTVDIAANQADVFYRFLYFLYSGTVWLHRSYIWPLYQLADFYIVPELLFLCFDMMKNNLKPDNGNFLFSLDAIHQIHNRSQDETIRKLAESNMQARFENLVKETDLWLSLSKDLVIKVLKGDGCYAYDGEDALYEAAYRWVTNSKDRDSVAVDVLSYIRYPLLSRGVLYKAFKLNKYTTTDPGLKAMVQDAINYKCFSSVKEAEKDFTGKQYQKRDKKFIIWI
ncbi:unnamed protein product [Owenia fusiformis]|uniref:BTB domain-containing protein n=1 Tax=Owenia fusiformis TaxID=6347 RepID=A0A8S4PX07_OWEFU|nr:unnamed protein product [Owenia fusiformis]